MTKTKVIVIDEIVSKSEIYKRHSYADYYEHEDGSWEWARPADRLNEEALAKWDAIMEKLSNIDGEDLRHLICGVGLIDHCTNN